MLRGLMMDTPLNVSAALEYGAEMHPTASMVSATVEGGMHRATYAETLPRVAQLANALKALGVKEGDRVATLAWNGYRHVELYYAIGGIGAVCHTINPRLFPEQLTYIVNHAKDRVVFFDINLAPLVAKMRALWPKDIIYVAMTDTAHKPTGEGLDGVLVYEELLAAQPKTIAWPQVDERAAVSLCYTSGTTGDPKGALYSQRSVMLHALFTLTAGMKGLQTGKTILPVVPLFHANCWSLAFSTPMTGASLVLPGPKLDGPSVLELLDTYKVTFTAGVPTVWLMLLQELEKTGGKLPYLKRMVIGGSASPRAMTQALQDKYGIDVIHAWGMTEMSPLGTLCTLKEKHKDLPEEDKMKLLIRSY